MLLIVLSHDERSAANATGRARHIGGPRFVSTPVEAVDQRCARCARRRRTRRLNPRDYHLRTAPGEEQQSS